MIELSDVAEIVHALQTVKLRPNITFCLVVVDLEDGTISATAPDGINKKAILQAVAERYADGPQSEFDIPQVS